MPVSNLQGETVRRVLPQRLRVQRRTRSTGRYAGLPGRRIHADHRLVRWIACQGTFVAGQADLGALVRAAADGRQAAWDELVDRFSGLLWAVARGHRLGHADAEDVVQTCWLRLAEHLGRIEHPERLGGWLATTARNECLGVLRRGARELMVEDDEKLGGSTDPDVTAGLVERERGTALWSAFSRLDERCQLLLRVLMADEPPSYQAVSESLEMPIGAIGPTRQRCLDKLRRLLPVSEINLEGAT